MKNDVVRWRKNIQNCEDFNCETQQINKNKNNNNNNNNNNNFNNNYNYHNNCCHYYIDNGSCEQQEQRKQSLLWKTDVNFHSYTKNSNYPKERTFHSINSNSNSTTTGLPKDALGCATKNENNCDNRKNYFLVQKETRNTEKQTVCSRHSFSCPPSSYLSWFTYRLLEKSAFPFAAFLDTKLKNVHNLKRSQKRASCPEFLQISFLQISVIVFLCSFGYVAAAATTKTITTTPIDAGVHKEQPLENVGDSWLIEINDNSGSSGGSNLLHPDGHFTHTWAVHIPDGDKDGRANAVALEHGFVNLGKIFHDHYHFAHHKVAKRSLEPAIHQQTYLGDDTRVHWAQQQRAKSRSKRDFIRMRPSRTSSRAVSLVDAVPFMDPKWPQMWYLNRGGGLDMNVIPAWKEGITGKGIVVTILDDGLESDHPDIVANYDPKASYDVNSHDDDPMPHYDMTDSNRHGTRCAGEVAATANNSICAVGIAYGASVGGVRMLDGDVTDAVEARSLSLNPQHIDIYSASWGPDDDGKTVDGPGELASRAFIEGVTKGRNGKGSIFIWASGNGGRELDNCNCDGYTNSIWTLSISSATEEGHVPWYSEKCSSTLATTYSSGGQGEKQVVTTDLHHSCTVSHTGTSASAPLAAGIAALVLESNQNLTWRDLQHIVVRTAKPANLKDPTWSKNGVGRRISHSFGYGLMDAAAMVKVARAWKTVPEQQRCEINAPHVDKVIPPKSYITLQLTVKHCLSVNYLEHVQAKITLTSQRRGDIQLYLKSPAGTKVTLLTSRLHDVSRSGFNQWPFMSVHTWGESPHGNWQLEIHNEGRYMAQITQWDLIFYGTETPAQPEDPVQMNSDKFSPFGTDIEHNDIEYDASGQWHNMQQVGESRVMSNDRTSTACLKTTTIDQRCLACAPPTYLYDGRCYQECPKHTYPIVDLSKNDNNSIPKTNTVNDEMNSVTNTIEPPEQLQSIDRRDTTPEDTVEDLLQKGGSHRLCALCDPSCLQCYGPFNSQCSTCYPGSQLRKQPHTNETYCYMFAERSSGQYSGINNNSEAANDKQSKIRKPILIAVPALFVVSIVISVIASRRYCSQKVNSGTAGGVSQFGTATYTYDRVALLPDDDEEADAEVDLFTAPIPLTTDTINEPTIIEAVAASCSDSQSESGLSEEEDLFTIPPH